MRDPSEAPSEGSVGEGLCRGSEEEEQWWCPEKNLWEVKELTRSPGEGPRVRPALTVLTQRALLHPRPPPQLREGMKLFPRSQQPGWRNASQEEEVGRDWGRAVDG